MHASRPRPTGPPRHPKFLSPFRQKATATHSVALSSDRVSTADGGRLSPCPIRVAASACETPQSRTSASSGVDESEFSAGSPPASAARVMLVAAAIPSSRHLGSRDHESHRDEPNNQLDDDLHAATQFLEPPLDCALLNGAEPEMPKPADLAALGLRPPDYFTVTRSLSTLTAAAARNGVLGRVDAHLTEVSVAFPTNSDSYALGMNRANYCVAVVSALCAACWRAVDARSGTPARGRPGRH
jgi:hypothetical protein